MILSLVFKSLSMLFLRKNLAENQNFLKFFVALLAFGIFLLVLGMAFYKRFLGKIFLRHLFFILFLV